MKWLAAFFLTVLLAPMFLQLSVEVWFLVNREYISTNLCENRDRPMLHCDGKCVLAEKLNAAEASSESDFPPTTRDFKLEPFELATAKLKALTAKETLSLYTTWVSPFHPQRYTKNIFNPPESSV